MAFHLRQVFRKLGIRSRVELTRIALKEGGTDNDAPPLGDPAGRRGAAHGTA